MAHIEISKSWSKWATHRNTFLLKEQGSINLPSRSLCSAGMKELLPDDAWYVGCLKFRGTVDGVANDLHRWFDFHNGEKALHIIQNLVTTCKHLHARIQPHVRRGEGLHYTYGSGFVMHISVFTETQTWYPFINHYFLLIVITF